MRYFVYCRKSTDREDRQILGTDAQKRLLVEHAARQGLTVVEVYVDGARTDDSRAPDSATLVFYDIPYRHDPGPSELLWDGSDGVERLVMESEAR